VAINPVAPRAYAGAVHREGDTYTSQIVVVDTTTDTVIDAVSLDLAAFMPGVAVTPDGTTVYATYYYEAESGPRGVAVLDTATNTIVTTLDIPAYGVAVSPVAPLAYVTGGITGYQVSVIDTTTNTVTGTFATGYTPVGVAFSPDGATAYITYLDDTFVSVVDTATNTITGTIAIGPASYAVVVTPNGATIYVTMFQDSTVRVIPVAP